MSRDKTALSRILSQDRDVPHAVLVELEDEHDLPVTVKYGDADAIKQSCRERVCLSRYPHPEGWLLFRLEDHGTVPQERAVVKSYMQAIGAWFIGWQNNEMHYLWPTDHPVTDMH